MDDDLRLPLPDLTAFAARLLRAHGADPVQAEQVAEVLAWSDGVGRDNQGVWRLPILCRRLALGLFRCPCELSPVQRADALYQLDGRGGMGHYVARQAMDIAVAGARRTGVAAVAVHDANFFGAAAYYVDRAARAGCVGLAFGNSFPKVVAHGGRHPVLGTNPLAVGAPRADGATFLLDMATSAVAGSTVRRANERGQPLGQGDGVEARGPAGEALLLPLAGAKGFGLALAVEILAGVLTGAGIGHGVRSMYEDLSESGHNGQLFVALDVETLMPLDRFCARMEELAEQVRASGDGLRLPGELRTDRLQAARREGVAIAAATRVALASLAASCGVRSPW